MSREQQLVICIIGSSDFIRRMTSAASQIDHLPQQTRLEIVSGNPGEARALALSFRPKIMVYEVGFKTSADDLLWTKKLLATIRERFKRQTYHVVAVTTPEKFVHAGNLLFADSSTLEPSGLVDNLIISPPSGTPSVPSLEKQLQDVICCAAELFVASGDNSNNLPALSDYNWAPTICDPLSRDIWMRWLPRYSSYVNENPLIVGPSGSGKTRLASALHHLSGRTGPFISITPRDFSSTELVQAELFGAVPGAYTGAVEKWGLVRKAEKGTLFIDELQSIDFDLQGKLITFIENKSYRRVGETESHRADVRFVFATNRSLQELVEQGRLRDDFAYRLERLQLTLSPLEERRLDIAGGICLSLAKILRERKQTEGAKSIDTTVCSSPLSGSGLEGLSSGAYRKLFGTSWPGNLRQLENCIAKMIESSNIKGTLLIDENDAEQALQGLLGRIEITPKAILSQAALNTARFAESTGFESLSQCSVKLKEQARLIALENSGGRAEDAAELLNDSIKAIEIFIAARELATDNN